MAIKRGILSVTAVVLASVVTAHAQTPVDVGGTFQQIGQAENAGIPAIMHEAAFLFVLLRSPHQGPGLDSCHCEQLRPARGDSGGCTAGAESLRHHDAGNSDCFGPVHESVCDGPIDAARRSNYYD